MTDKPRQLRYVVLRHDGIAEPHFDLMFEREPGGPLATWRSLQWPLQAGSTLVRLTDHRHDYLTYEGPVSGNRGTVTRISRGEFEWAEADVVHVLTPVDEVWRL